MEGGSCAPAFFPSRISVSLHRFRTHFRLERGLHQVLRSHVSAVSLYLTWFTKSELNPIKIVHIEEVNRHKAMAACFGGQASPWISRDLWQWIRSKSAYHVPMLPRCPTFAQTQMYITPHPNIERIRSLCEIYASSLNSMSLHLATSGQKWKSRVFIGGYDLVNTDEGDMI